MNCQASRETQQRRPPIEREGRISFAFSHIFTRKRFLAHFLTRSLWIHAYVTASLHLLRQKLQPYKIFWDDNDNDDVS